MRFNWIWWVSLIKQKRVLRDVLKNMCIQTSSFTTQWNKTRTVKKKQKNHQSSPLGRIKIKRYWFRTLWILRCKYEYVDNILMSFSFSIKICRWERHQKKKVRRRVYLVSCWCSSYVSRDVLTNSEMLGMIDGDYICVTLSISQNEFLHYPYPSVIFGWSMTRKTTRIVQESWQDLSINLHWMTNLLKRKKIFKLQDLEST